ncbi:MAG: hypothetical protein KME40_08590 [Komarekiella atlantica HA4396-MV6]|jgi:hypothetical protein|nr:hypothetical protein [Komarekiella atlantica HA4396-MV6]
MKTKLRFIKYQIILNIPGKLQLPSDDRFALFIAITAIALLLNQNALASVAQY